MSGLNLKEMEASDMLDVIHFLFEEDSHYISEESMKSRSGMRTKLYEELYGVSYKYEYHDPKKTGNYKYSFDPEDDFGPMSEAESVKPFTPSELQKRKPTMGKETITKFDPTAANPFDGILDAPMN